MKIPFFTGNGGRESAGRRGAATMVGRADPVFAEQYKVLRAKFEYRAATLNQKVVAVTSAVAGEGKTVASLNLSVSLAGVGNKKILLVDADIRKGDLSLGMDVPRSPGLTEHLAGAIPDAGAIVRKTAYKNLHLVTCGMEFSDPGDLLAGERFGAFLGEARKSFDFIILDAPPVLPVADTLTIRDHVDSLILVYRVSFTPVPMFRQAVEEIGEGKIMGVVLNGVEPESQRYYSRYYGRYYRKDSKAETSV